ncbi:response regulator [Anaerovorax odorimutans]|uniref:hypothetical protein n=1 Tax=Anaerovorax odorimutans TaxID=109327 RepID=UPI00041F765F|nr:hypothetical protein [Anaerovorax odorimutans]
MTKSIALCGVQDEIAHALERHGGYKILPFGDEPERRGDVKLGYFLRDGSLVELAVVGYPGAKGLAACDYLRTQNCELPILWLCDRQEFEPEAKRLGIGFCGTGPPNTEQTIQGILKTINMRGSEGGTK